ncbi:MAG: hypothetical protein ACK4P5_07040 [Fimbriimonadales bacterium]
MNRKALTVVLLWGSFLLSWAQVELPLGYYSFAEIAQRMSVEGRTVECARDLQQRLAVIHLKPRSWQQTRELLESALDVRFRKISDAENRWVLERNPEVVRKERRWREQLATYIEKRRGRDIRMFRMLMDNKVPPEVAVERLMETYREDIDPSEVPDEAQLRAQMKQTIESFRKFPMELALRDWRAFLRMNKRFSEFFRHGLTDAGDPTLFGFYSQFLAENPLSSFGFSKELLDWAQRAVTDEQDATLSALRAMMGEIGVSTDQQTMQLLLLRSLGMFGFAYGQVWAHDALIAQLRPPISVLETIEQGVLARDYTVVLPPEQLAWHLNDVEGKRVPLDAPAPIPTPLIAVAAWKGYAFSATYLFPDALPSSDFLGFGANTIDDSVMVRWEPKHLKRLLPQIDAELARAYEQAYARHQQLASQPPVNQPLKVPHVKAAVLAEVAYRWAKEHHQEVVMEVLGVFRWSYGRQGDSLAKQLETSQTPYLLEQRNGVWILRCWNAFVERVGDYPFAAVRDLLSSNYSYEAWQRFYREVSTEQARWLLSEPWHFSWDPREKSESLMRSVSSYDLGAAWLIMAILESLPPVERERFWNPPSDAPAPTLEIARLPLEVRTRIAQTLTLWRAALLQHTSPRHHAALLTPPNAWSERLTLQRDSAWTLNITLIDPLSGEASEVPLLETYLPGAPILLEDSEEENAP